MAIGPKTCKKHSALDNCDCEDCKPVAANKTPQLDLLLMDVKIQFDELRRLRTENDMLREENEQLKAKLFGETQEDKDELAYYIHSQRVSMRLGYEKFARLVGSTGTTIRKYENGVGSLRNMQEIADNIRKIRRG